tara:strand:+ start:381097 stop:381273 length:177 start_codon:yes stop_codon:yes gene_type:complete
VWALTKELISSDFLEALNKSIGFVLFGDIAAKNACPDSDAVLQRMDNNDGETMGCIKK